MDDKLIIEALGAKRSRLAAELERHRETAARLEGAIASIDGTLAVFANDAHTKPEFDVEGEGSSNRDWTRGGTGVVHDALREAGRPMTAMALTQMIVARQGGDPDDRRTVVSAESRVRSYLRHYQRRDVLASAPGKDGLLEWSLA